MDEHADHALQAAVKALAEVVAPAVDPTDALAVDQLRLVISWLQFHGARRRDEPRLAWAALRLRLAQAREVQALIEGAVPLGQALREACAAAEARLHTPVEGGRDAAGAWGEAAQALDGAVCAALAALEDGPDALRLALADVVLAHARDSVMLQRAWFAPLGFEARPEAVPPLEQLLARPGGP